MDADGQRETAVVTAAGSRRSPVWTPDGAHLLFIGHAPRESALWSIDVRDGQAVSEPSIVQDPFADAPFAAPIAMTTSGTLYYARRVGGAIHEFVVPRHPAPGDRALTFPGLGASWSRDGQRLAYWRGAGTSSDLVVRDVNTGEERSYRRAGMTPSSPKWLNDGSGVIVGINEQGSSTFYHVDVRSGTFRRLFAKDASDHVRSMAGAISVDDKTLYLTVRNSAGTPWTGIVGVNLATGVERSVVTFGSAGLPESVGRVWQ